jgi:head-tail adaptor
VLLGKPTKTQDDAGAESITWADLAVYANIEPLSGREYFAAGMMKDPADVRITIRAIPGWIPLATWRVRNAATGDVWNIVTVQVNPNNALVEMMGRTVPVGTDGR